jgi:hypothetical protein
MPSLLVNAAYYLYVAVNTVAGSIVLSQAAAIAVVNFVALTAASMAASKLLAPKMPSFSDSSLSERSQMVRSPIASRQIIYGTSKVSGVMVYISTTGSKNQYLHLVVAIAGHQVEEIGDVYFGDELALTGTGSSAQGRFAGKAEIYKQLGGPAQVAQPQLVAATAGLTDGKWTSAHRLRGIAYIYVQLTWDTEVFANGIPNISAIVKGKPVYDPRTTTTVWSANPALCLRDYLTSDLGLAMSSTEIDDDAVTAAANICDEQVQVLPLSPATYENRYECNGVLSTSESPDSNIGKLLSAMGGLIAYSGGKIVVYASGYRIPTVTLTEKHFAGGMSVQTRTSARDRVNAVKGVYISSENKWQVSDFPSIAPSAYYSADNSVRYWRDVVLPFTTSSSCAQRLAVIELRRAREEITFTARFRLEAMQVRAGDTVMITNAKLGWSSKVFEVMEWHFTTEGNPPNIGVEMTMRETASSVYDWTVGDEIAVPDSPNTTLPNPYNLSAPTNLTLTANGTTQLIQADGTAMPRILVSWSAPAEEFIQSGGMVGIEYKQSTETTYLTWSRVSGDQTQDYISSDVKIGLTYDVRIFGESYFNVSTSYLTAQTGVAKDTTAPAIPTGLAATIGTGKAVSLDWNDNTEPDFSEYGVYRFTSAVTASASKIAETRASRFIDTEVTLGTTYFYWINAYDTVENVSSLCNYVSATPVAITAGSADSTAPSTPSAPTLKSSTVYLSTDGTSFARVSLTAPGLPTGAVALDVLYRRSGASDWIVGNQIASSVSFAVSIDDLSVGVAYEFAARGISFSGALSSVSSVLGQSAPSNTTAPSAPTSLTYIAGNSSSFQRSPEFIGGVLAYSFRVNWTPASDKSVLSYEAVNTVTDTDAAADADYALGYFFRQSIPEEIFSNLGISVGYIRVRSVDRSGQKSAWAGGGVNVSAYWGLPAGTMTSQNASAVNIAGGSATLATVAISDGSATLATARAASLIIAPAAASNPRANLALYAGSDVKNFTGGATTETLDVDITNRGFTAKPDWGLIQIYDTNFLGVYDFDTASSSTNARFVVFSRDGANLASGNRRYHFIVGKY